MLKFVADILETIAAFFAAYPPAAKIMSSLSADVSSLYQHGLLPAGNLLVQHGQDDGLIRLVQVSRLACLSAFRQIVVSSSLGAVTEATGEAAKEVAGEQFLSILTGRKVSKKKRLLVFTLKITTKN